MERINIPMTKSEYESKLLSYHDDETILNLSVDKSGKKRVLKRTIIEEIVLTD